MSFLDKAGLSRLWANIVALVDTKISDSRTHATNLFLTSPNGTRYTITVNDSGQLIATEYTE